jgi:hypothetical protein
MIGETYYLYGMTSTETPVLYKYVVSEANEDKVVCIDPKNGWATTFFRRQFDEDFAKDITTAARKLIERKLEKVMHLRNEYYIALRDLAEAKELIISLIETH